MLDPNAEKAWHEDESSRYKAILQRSLEKNRWIQRRLTDDESPEHPRDLRPDFRKHPMQWSEIVKRCFSRDIIKFIAP